MPEPTRSGIHPQSDADGRLLQREIEWALGQARALAEDRALAKDRASGSGAGAGASAGASAGGAVGKDADVGGDTATVYIYIWPDISGFEAQGNH